MRTPKDSALTPQKFDSWSFKASALFLPTEGFTYACDRQFFDSTRSKSIEDELHREIAAQHDRVRPERADAGEHDALRGGVRHVAHAPNGTFGRR